MSDMGRLRDLLEGVLDATPQKVLAHKYGRDVSEISRLKRGCALLAQLLADEGYTVRKVAEIDALRAEMEAVERALHAQLKRRFDGAA